MYNGKLEWLENIRYMQRMSQSRVAAEAGISQAAYNRIELGYDKPTRRTAQAIADVLGFDVNRFAEIKEYHGNSHEAHVLKALEAASSNHPN